MNRVKEILNKCEHFSLIEHDTLGIVKRLQEFDPSYFVVRNHLENRFEVHSTDNIGLTFCFIPPDNVLDYRTIEYAKMTYVPHKGDKLIKQMELYNEKQEENRRINLRKRIEEGAHHAREYFERDLNNLELYEGYRKSVYF